MRNLAVMLVAMLALSGCTNAPDDADELPGNPDGGLPGGQPGAGAGSQPGQGVAPQQGLEEDTDSDLHLSGILAPCDAGYCVDATASIEGLDSYYVSNICVPPHGDRMERDGAEVQHREPTAYCAAFGLREWTRDEQIQFQYKWDGQVWDDAQGKLVAAENGGYQWSILFHAWTQPDGGERRTLEITFSVVVGET